MSNRTDAELMLCMLFVQNSITQMHVVHPHKLPLTGQTIHVLRGARSPCSIPIQLHIAHHVSIGEQ